MQRVRLTWGRPKRFSEARIADMYALFRCYYKDVTEERFRADLAEKDLVFLFEQRALPRRLVGFSTIFRREATVQGRRSTFLFSGDTVMAADCWGLPHLKFAFFVYIFLAKLRSPFRPVYWMLVSKGYKTYLMMVRNFGYSFPSRERPNAARAQAAMDAFYGKKYGADYDAAAGLIRHPQPLGAVADGYAHPAPAAVQNPDVAFFLERNPNFHAGDELACLAEVRFADFPRHVRKYVVTPVARFFLAAMPRKLREPRRAAP